MAKKRILLVDDEPNILKILRKRFEVNNYEVEIAFNGKQGVEKALLWKPDLIVLDLLMPDMDGAEVCGRLKLNDGTARIPVVMLTAAGIANAEKIGEEAGALAVINKPFLNDLVGVVEEVFGRQAGGEELA